MLLGPNDSTASTKKAPAKNAAAPVEETIFRKGSPEYQEMFKLMMDGTIKMNVRPGIIRESFLHWRNKYKVNDFWYAFTRVKKDAIAEMEKNGFGKQLGKWLIVDFFLLMTLTFLLLLLLKNSAR